MSASAPSGQKHRNEPTLRKRRVIARGPLLLTLQALCFSRLLPLVPVLVVLLRLAIVTRDTGLVRRVRLGWPAIRVVGIRRLLPLIARRRRGIVGIRIIALAIRVASVLIVPPSVLSIRQGRRAVLGEILLQRPIINSLQKSTHTCGASLRIGQRGPVHRRQYPLRCQSWHRCRGHCSNRRGLGSVPTCCALTEAIITDTVLRADERRYQESDGECNHDGECTNEKTRSADVEKV